MTAPLMPKASASWLIDNTTLTFQQISAYSQLHELEIQAIADGEVPIGATTYDPITQKHLSWEEINRCEANPQATLVSLAPNTLLSKKRKGGRYTPVAKRGDRPNAIAWMIKHYPDLPDAKVCQLLGTTRPTIKNIRDKTHARIKEIKAQHPVQLELCTQKELDKIVGVSTTATETAAE